MDLQMTLAEQLEKYACFNEQEEKDKEILMHFAKADNAWTRDNTVAHFTASAWVVNQDFTKVLMCYHNLYHSWSWLGGHADGDKDLLHVAVREVQEESGLKSVTPVSSSIYSIEVLTVDGHEKKGYYVSGHLHLNVTYLLQADDHASLHSKPDENSGVRWFPLEEAVSASEEEWFREHIYSKLNTKLRERKTIL